MDIQTVRQKYPQYGDLSDDQLASALHKKHYSDIPYGEFAGKIGLKTDAPKPKGKSAVDLALGVLTVPMRELPGIKRGIEDIVDAGAQNLVRYAVPDSVVNLANRALGSKLAPTSEQLLTQQAQEERGYQAQRPTGGIDAGRLVGNMIGTAPLAAVLPGPGATILGTAAKGAMTGAAVGGMTPVTDDTRSFDEQKKQQVMLGAASGGIAAPLLQMASRVISPQVDKAVAYLQERGVRPRPGQLIGPRAAAFEDKAMSAPIVGDAIAASQRRAMEDFNLAAYNEVLKPLGTKYSGPVGRDGIANIQDSLSKAYDDVLPNIRFVADKPFVSEFKNIAKMAQSLPPDKYKQFQTVMENDLIPRMKGGNMDGIAFKEMEGELGKFARTYASSASPDDRQLANAVREILGSARSALERTNPKFAPQLRKINQSYAMFTRVQDAAARVGTEEGVFSTNHLLSAVQRLDKSARKGAFARGDALLQRLAENGKKVLGIKYPDSGTAGRLANMGAGMALVTNPVPTIGAGLIGSLPYTQTGQNIANSLLTKRSPWAKPVGEVLNRVAVPGGGVAGPLGAGLLFAPEEERNNYNGNRR